MTCPTRRANSAAERLGVAVVKCRPDFGSTTPNTFANAAPFILVVLLGWLAWFGRYRRAHVGVQLHRFLIQANDGLSRIVGFLIDGQHVFHLLDVFLVQLRHAPHFFPATASTRGFAARPGLSLVPHLGQVCVLWPLRRSSGQSSEPVLPAVDCKPWR